MSSIQRMPTATPTEASQIPFYDPNNGRDSKCSITDLAELLQSLLNVNGELTTQAAAPSGSGFSVTVTPPVEGGSVWLKLSPLGAYAAGGVVLPLTPVEGQEVLVTSTQTVTALGVTVAGISGASVIGGPTTIGTATPFRMRYNQVDNAWYRVV